MEDDDPRGGLRGPEVTEEPVSTGRHEDSGRYAGSDAKSKQHVHKPASNRVKLTIRESPGFTLDGRLVGVPSNGPAKHVNQGR